MSDIIYSQDYESLSMRITQQRAYDKDDPNLYDYETLILCTHHISVNKYIRYILYRNNITRYKIASIKDLGPQIQEAILESIYRSDILISETEQHKIFLRSLLPIPKIAP